MRIDTPQKKKKNNPLTRGSVLIITSFLLLVITLITVSYWKLIQLRLMILTNNEQETRAYYAARAGIETAIYEFNIDHNWTTESHNSYCNWRHDTANTYYITNKNKY